jgi:hypothetical protein
MTTLTKIVWGITSLLALIAAACCVVAGFNPHDRDALDFGVFFALCTVFLGWGAVMLSWIGRSSRGRRESPNSDDAEQNQVVTLLSGLDRMEQRMENLETIIDARPRDRSLDDEFARLKGDRA